jgi:hypothetical protein
VTDLISKPKPWDHVSASQVEAYRRCPRFWFNQSVLKIRTPPSPAQERGSKCHKTVETFFETGALVGDTEALAITQPVMSLLPPRGEELLVEHKIEMATYVGGPSWIGYIDYFDPREHPIHVGDLKSTSDIRYCKTPSELVGLVQMNSYAHWALGEYPAENEVRLSHTYMVTRRPHKAHVVQAVTNRSIVSQNWSRDLATVREMQAWATERPETADALPPNTNACDMYGGCAFRKQCGLMPKLNLFRNLEKKKMTDAPTNGTKPMSLSERLAAKRAVANGIPLAGAAPVPSVVAVATPPATIVGAPPIVGAAAQAQVAAYGETLPTGAGLAATMPTGIVPPDAPARDAATFVAPPTPTPEPVKKTRGRPKKEAAPEVATATPPAAIPTLTPQTAGVSAKPQLATPFELWIDTIAVKGAKEITTAEDWLAPIVEAVSEDNGIQDPRLIAFGGGKVAVANAIRESLGDVPPVLLVNSMSPYAHELIEILTPYATRVFRALRG